MAANNIDYSNWNFYKKGLISMVPPYREVTVNKKILFNHFKGAFYIRWDSDFDKTDNHNYYHVIKDGGCAIESLPPKTRNQIRRCLKNCEIKIVDYQYVINGGGIRSMPQNTVATNETGTLLWQSQNNNGLLA